MATNNSVSATPAQPTTAGSPTSRPRIFAATFVSEIFVGAHIGGVGALIVLLAQHFDTSINRFAILSSFLGVGMVVFSLLSKWLMRATAGMVLRGAATLVISGACGLAFAPWIWLVIASGVAVGSGASLIILIVPAVLAGPRRARDIALANGASSAASIASPLLYGFFDSLPGFNGRWAVLMLAIPALYVLATIRNVDFINTPSAFAERWHGRVGLKRRKDLSDAFGQVASVQAFGGAENVADDEMARAVLAQGASQVHVPDLETDKPTRTPWWRTAIALFRVALSLVTEFALYTWGVARLIELGVPTSTAATMGAVFPLGMAIGRLSAGVLIQWKFIFQASIACSVLGSFMIGLGTSLPQLIAGLLLAGFGTALLYPIVVDDMVALEGMTPNKAAALCSLGGGTAVFLLPIVLPMILHYLSLGHALLAVCPVATVLLWVLPSGRKKAAR